MRSGRSRFPRRVYGHGTEPDARFSLANERTFLTWVSTSLGLLSVGVGLESLAGSLQPGFRRAAAVLLIVTGMACALQALVTWTQVESALRQNRPLPAPALLPWLTASVVTTGVLVLLGVFTA